MRESNRTVNGGRRPKANTYVIDGRCEIGFRTVAKFGRQTDHVQPRYAFHDDSGSHRRPQNTWGRPLFAFAFSRVVDRGGGGGSRRASRNGGNDEAGKKQKTKKKRNGTANTVGRPREIQTGRARTDRIAPTARTSRRRRPFTRPIARGTRWRRTAGPSRRRDDNNTATATVTVVENGGDERAGFRDRSDKRRTTGVHEQ